MTGQVKASCGVIVCKVSECAFHLFSFKINTLLVLLSLSVSSTYFKLKLADMIFEGGSDGCSL